MNDETIRIAITGNVDSGKSTFAGVLVNNILDDGRGLCRSKILRNKHELDTGRTSFITFNKLNRIIDDKRKILSLIDLAGHEKYLKTTMSGITGLFLDYGLLLISANMGITKMTKEHLALLLYQKVPIIVLITKVDMVPEKVKNDTIKKIKKILNLPVFGKKTYQFPEDNTKCKDEMKLFSSLNDPLDTFIPIISISNKTGTNIENVKDFLFLQSNRSHWNSKIDSSLMYMDSRFNVKGIGVVVSGTVRGNDIKINDKLYMGPIDDKFIQVKVRSIHNNVRENVDKLVDNQDGCLAIRTINKDELTKDKIKRGVILFSNKDLINNICWSFKAEIVVLSHSTTISDNYQPVIHCGNVRQNAKIEMFDSKKKKLRAMDKAIVKFTFCFRKEYIEVDNIIFFRDGNTKGYGHILEIY